MDKVTVEPLSGGSLRRQLGRTIARLRQDRGWSQQDLADLLKVPRWRLSKWEAGSNAPPLEDQMALCGLLGLTVDELLRGDSPPPFLGELDEWTAKQIGRYLSAILTLLQTTKSGRPKTGS
jgi:transcriptional regulator with XRE-family HTH domain